MDVEGSLPLPHLLESSDLMTPDHLRKVSLLQHLFDIYKYITFLLYSWH